MARAKPKPAAEPTHLSLRFVRKDFTSYGGFQWPSEVGATVTAPDWRAKAECGHGLHGWLWGEGDAGCWSRNDDDRLLVVRHGAFVDIGGKVKFPTCTVEFIGEPGDTRAAPQWIAANGGAGKAINYLVVEAGYGSTITGGYGSTITGGYGSTITGGDGSTITGGNRSTITGGNGSTITGGDGSTITGGYGSTITGGYGSTITGGDGSTITGGDGSTITGGYGSTITGGYGSTITGGNGGIFYIRYYDGARYRTVEGVVGENGILPGVPYRFEDGKLVAVSK